ncbi:hypothetical protein [Streptomyces asiaticus]|uniref:hypothetical protein n=1 Tax=Streptomyces asiaticus TaxID=114695 RepID=UPI003F671A12
MVRHSRGPPLRLGDFLTGRQAKARQSPAHPTPGRNTGFLLRLAEPHASRAAAVADDDLTRVIAVHLPSGGQLDIHHAGHTTRT